MVNMLYKFSILQIFLLSLLLLAPLAGADPQTMIVGSGAICEKAKGAYGIGITFQIIRQKVVDSLVANAPPTGFNVSEFADESEGIKIYGLVQCRGDMNPSDCRECVSFAKQVLLNQCFSYVSASILLDGCFLRYANYSFYSTLATNGIQKYLNIIGYPKIPNATLANSLTGLIGKAASSENSFSVNLEVVESPVWTIYSLAQCWRDLNFQDCRQCLASLYDAFFSEPSAQIAGGRVFNLNCFLRVEVYNFFHLAALSSSQAIQSESRVIQNLCNNEQLMKGASKSDVKLVLDSLFIGVAKTGYATFSYRDSIYGLAQCRRDMSPDECSHCVLLAGQNLLETCRGNSAVNALSGCFVRYETYNFYANLDCKKGTTLECQNTNSPDERKFDIALFTLLPKLVDKVTANKGFSKSVDDETSLSQRIYSLAQCARDIDMEACKQCLVEASKYLNNCSQGALGGQFVSGCCYLRYLTVKFFHGDDSSGSKRRTLLIILFTSMSGTASMFMVLAVVLRKGRITDWLNRNADLQQNDEDMSDAIHGAMLELRVRYKFEILQSCTGNFNQENKLGQGAFGSVYKGVLPNGKEIAIKRLLFFNKDRGVKEFLNEVNMISNVRHKNLVKLLGCSVKEQERLLVYEYLSNKSLDYHLFDPISRNVLHWEKRIEIIQGVAAGLAYLHHESEIRIIHRDIKASNILLDENFKPKIADFGLARHFTEGQTHVSTGIAGTLGYMAPEYIVLGQLTEKADIFSFGVLVLEIMSGRKNNQSKSTQDIQSLPQQIWKHFMSNTVSEAVDPIIMESCGEESEKELYGAVHVGLLCTQASPALRPSMAQVVQMLISHNPCNLPAPAQPPFMDLNVGSHETTAFNPLSFNNFSYSSFEPR